MELYYNYTDFASLSADTYYPLYDMSNSDTNATSYGFCNGCKMLGVNIWDDDTYLSPYFLSLEASHCVDTFALTSAASMLLANNPPALLVEPYFRCKMSPGDAFIASVGIAAGNLGAFGPIAILVIVLPLIYLYLVDSEPPMQKYDLVKIMKAQREFIEKVLGANDGTLDGITKDSIIHKLGVELYDLAQFEEGKVNSNSNGNGNYNSISKVQPEDVPL